MGFGALEASGVYKLRWVGRGKGTWKREKEREGGEDEETNTSCPRIREMTQSVIRVPATTD